MREVGIGDARVGSESEVLGMVWDEMGGGAQRRQEGTRTSAEGAGVRFLVTRHGGQQEDGRDAVEVMRTWGSPGLVVQTPERYCV